MRNKTLYNFIWTSIKSSSSKGPCVVYVGLFPTHRGYTIRSIEKSAYIHRYISLYMCTSFFCFLVDEKGIQTFPLSRCTRLESLQEQSRYTHSRAFVFEFCFVSCLSEGGITYLLGERRCQRQQHSSLTLPQESYIHPAARLFFFDNKNTHTTENLIKLRLSWNMFSQHVCGVHPVDAMALILIGGFFFIFRLSWPNDDKIPIFSLRRTMGKLFRLM
jgi:hypothetical protein